MLIKFIVDLISGDYVLELFQMTPFRKRKNQLNLIDRHTDRKNHKL
jgi:hypothetical protein